jgi:hypothetical protein
VKDVLALGVLIALGCSNDFDSLYEGTGAGSGAAAPAEELPELPALPDEDRVPDCERCARDTCSTDRGNCLEDPDCIDELRCKGKCDDPDCLQRCSRPRRWSSPWYADYANCVFGQCAGECNVGDNWQCEGTYAWQAALPDMPRFEVEFWFIAAPTALFGNLPPTGVSGTVRACTDDESCSDPLDSDEVGLNSRVTLTLEAGLLPPRDFRGYLEIDAVQELLYTRPLARAQTFYAGFLRYDPPPPSDRDRPRVDVAVTDCLIAPVPNARVTLPRFPEIEALSFQFQNVPEFQEGPTNEVGIATLTDLPDSAADRKLVVRATRGEADELISERAVWVRPGWTTWVMLGPRARSD